MTSVPLRVLVVEDEVLVAIELTHLVEDMGHKVVGDAISSAEALELAVERRPDLALVDIHLHDGPTGVDVARRIREECGSMVLFMTANQKRVPDDFAGAAGLIAKPYSPHGVKEAIAYVEACIRDGVPDHAPPASLTLSPGFLRTYGARKQA
jgi:CheY-like chemotaxis protein